MPQTIKTLGVHHLGLTVPDLDRTAAFFTEILGFETVGGNPDYPAVFVSDGTVMVTLWRAADPEAATAFDRKANIGMHHVAFRVADAASLEALHARLATVDDCRVEFAPEPLRGGPIRHMMCEIPGGIRVEFIAV
ncbi:MAG: VOC family protein [Alphaproteobacteria bacterium]